MDEVEAALDDTQPGPPHHPLRGVARDSSQPTVITHQKKTMEIADALYGVTMRGDGITTVVSQRLRDCGDGQRLTRIGLSASARRSGDRSIDGAETPSGHSRKTTGPTIRSSSTNFAHP